MGTPESEDGHSGSDAGIEAEACREELCLKGCGGRLVLHSVAKQIAGSPALVGRVFHLSCLPGDQGPQGFSRNDGAATDTDGAQAASRDVVVDGGFAQA